MTTSRDAANGENVFNGEYLVNAQGEDVVAGIRTPQQITKLGSQRWAERAGISEEERAEKYLIIAKTDGNIISCWAARVEISTHEP